MTQLTEQYYAVEVPEDATDFTVDREDEESMLYYFNGDNIDSTVEVLPEGTWKFLFTTKGMTGDQAAQIVRELPVGSRYENYCAGYPFWFRTAGESLSSLLRSKELDTEKYYAILKKEP